MVRREALFSGGGVLLWQVTWIGCVGTGLLHFPLHLHLPRILVNMNTSLWHICFACMLLCLALYSLLIWFARRREFRLTWIGKWEILLYGLLITSGVLLLLGSNGILSLYGLAFFFLKGMHCVAAGLIVITEILHSFFGLFVPGLGLLSRIN